MVFQDFTTDFYFRQYWQDPRLSFTPLPGIETIMVSTEFLNHIWVPDTFFANEKTSYSHMATTSNEFLRISYNGEINRSIRYYSSSSNHPIVQSFIALLLEITASNQIFVYLHYMYLHFRLTVTASCPMKLSYFPLDRQLCTIEIESCKYLIGFESLQCNILYFASGIC